MNELARTNSRIEAEYRARTKTSARLFDEASRVLPAGLTHDSRALKPYPLYAARAAGPRKWDVDGHEYVDFFGGHGALILGHAHPAVVEAVQHQITLGTHWGAAHELEVRWAEQVNRMVPCAERVRFTSSGTEASHMALRLARAYTGKRKVVRFVGHFHGWHDQVATGSNSHFDGSVPAGILPEIVSETILLPTDDPARVEEVLASRDDVAAVMLEAGGASTGQVPLPPGFLAAVRASTAKHGVVMLLDEVVTGFRWSPGGAQQRSGVIPDMCILAKILAGGLPGGAVVGRGDIMDQLDPVAASAAGREKIGHQGTYNANPLCAAAALATLKLIESEDICGTAERTANTIRDGMRKILVEEGVAWGVYGDVSYIHIFQNPAGLPLDPMNFDPVKLGFKGLKGAKNPNLIHRLRIAMLCNGADLNGSPGGLVSAVHGPAEVARTLEAFRTSVRWLKAEGDIVG
ncbi:MAG: aminotransferase class III-fold pyridoxal phosphate-dependent enzyme [Hyphomicrobiaceae bacterium]|nr:aminotransferase class III-fold pyridoxal phosphate-dependent enzyme [Hyphomicrobiaceae bacterium]